MTVTLSAEQEQAIAKVIESGKFQSVGEFIDWALHSVSADSESHLVWDKGMLIYTGKIDPGFDWENHIERDREERIQQIIGPYA